MGHSYNYAVAQFRAPSLRDERLNVGIVVFDGSTLDVRLPKSLDKLKAISAALDLDSVRHHLMSLTELNSYLISEGVEGLSERLSQLGALSAVGFSPLAEFFAPSHGAYELIVNRLVSQLVDPEPPPSKPLRRRPTRLFSAVKLAFRSERILAQKGEGLDAHRVVTHQKIAEGLEADLLLKNGAMHVIQTVDAGIEESSIRKVINEIGLSALVFDCARMSYGTDATKARLVYRASAAHELLIAPALEVAAHQGAHLVNWASRDDRTRFVVELSSLANPLEKAGKAARSAIHASTQHRFKIN